MMNEMNFLLFESCYPDSVRTLLVPIRDHRRWRASQRASCRLTRHLGFWSCLALASQRRLPPFGLLFVQPDPLVAGERLSELSPEGLVEAKQRAEGWVMPAAGPGPPRVRDTERSMPPKPGLRKGDQEDAHMPR